MKKFDVVVIGAGPGGYVAAIRAAQLGQKVAIVEREHLGGICLNWGCIPTKALLKCSEKWVSLKKSKQFGIHVGESSFNLQEMVEHSIKVSTQLTGGISGLMRKNKIEVLEGTAELLGAKKFQVTHKNHTETYQSQAIILATGARARPFPGVEFDEKLICSYKGALRPSSVPQKLLVIGSGAIGMEFANFYSDLGSQVTVVETASRILPVEDDEISAFVEKQFLARGVKFIKEGQVKALKKGKDFVQSVIQTKEEEKIGTYDRVIVAIGVLPNVENVGLDKTKARFTVGKGVETNPATGATSEPGLYAIGDVAAPPRLAHKASHEAIVCAEVIAGVSQGHETVNTLIPACTYTYPQVASIGLTERDLKAQGKKYKKGNFPFMANGRAIAAGEVAGFMKTLFDPQTGELLGAHLVGPEVSELLAPFIVAKSLEATEEDLFNVVMPHPTLSEMSHEAVLDAFARALHK